MTSGVNMGHLPHIPPWFGGGDYEAMSHDRTVRRLLAAALLSVGVAGAVCGPGVGLARADPGDPPPPPPPHPFCTPRGGLFIVGPICDEIGVGPPERTAPPN
jgi:hypothetical protein